MIEEERKFIEAITPTLIKDKAMFKMIDLKSISSEGQKKLIEIYKEYHYDTQRHER